MRDVLIMNKELMRRMKKIRWFKEVNTLAKLVKHQGSAFK